MKNKLAVSAGLVLSFAPFVVFAQQQAGSQVTDLITNIAKWVSSVVPILITIAIIYFIWAVIKYTLSTDEEAKKGAKDSIIYAIIGLVVIFGMWGIIAFVKNTFGINEPGAADFQTPKLNGASILK